ncbi:uncharacterized protein LOC110183549 [Drosophila serrata]|uniref:uncharacterized protein LOC110183491 n=1 Tax=Drosophila serrata TaxID=7274 RepID=UPI000A1D20FC|nr:uncharacterized protein LOC110183491 [Drosophila serrata]XP_020807503.1 uncharacterized protein LOC110183549 [Drosophila serrata]
MDILPVALLLLMACASVMASPMVYKLNPEEKYEADLVAVSSTVIPLTVLEVSYGAGGKPSEEYKAAYLRKLRKQVLQRADKQQQQQQQQQEEEGAPTLVGHSQAAAVDADALITVKSQLERAKVKAV